jgi:hypothetical protein
MNEQKMTSLQDERRRERLLFALFGSSGLHSNETNRR